MHIFLDPVGLFAPNVTVVNATAVVVTWTIPQEPNGIILGYNVTISLPIQVATEQVLVANLSTTIIVTNLTPFTSYVAYVTAFNSVGNVMSNGTSFTTGESGMKYNFHYVNL